MTAKQDAFITKWFPQAVTHYNNMLKRSSDELWSTLGTEDARRAFILYQIFCSEFAKHREEFIRERLNTPDKSRERICGAWGRFFVQMKRLREATNVLLLVWEAYKNGHMGHEKQQWFQRRPEAFQEFVQTFPETLEDAAARGSWS
ncbi:uncharacterized protein MYCFIDRAFT_77411 [Pseudocercospora fijiensis CIRAD86]|uniref:Uncharacterized protein n=1 Tax=Pseudocercospora fijiensis (strain CIRAD86) TaxID=383855 RepID=M3A6R1_PSEFD|nr:uncharacterized protein MYCFIDRAFT_77411 [Pseudocercospora fijiensis CIRAD86]EME86769.1 hypothetical protein MYCFIDRAFT_77411 [Pseudocercospora fijiensis CIRAD86]